MYRATSATVAMSSMDDSVEMQAHLPWVVVFVASLFFFYEFIQMNMFNAINTSIMRDFGLTAGQLGSLSSLYFLSNVLFLLAAGTILDRFSTRKVILAALTICSLGTLFFALSTSIVLASICRFLTGIGSAFCFLSCVRLATRWFPPQRIALVTGLIVTMAMIGGMVAQTPLTLLVNAVGWREALVLDAAFGFVIIALIWQYVRDYPPQAKNKLQEDRKHLKSLGFYTGLKMAFLNYRNWLCGIYTCLLNLPLFILGGFLGSTFLSTVHGLTHTQSSYITSMIFIGTIFGSPFMGWASDQMGRRKPLMIAGALASIVVMLAIIHYTSLGMGGLIVLFLLLGFVTATQVISYPVVAESNSPLLTATCVSVVSFSAIGGGAVFEPVFGKIMDWHWNGQMLAGVPFYSAADYQFAMWMFPIGFIVSLIAALFIRETFCKNEHI